jgi:hypothetical protein
LRSYATGVRERGRNSLLFSGCLRRFTFCNMQLQWLSAPQQKFSRCGNNLAAAV